MAYTYQECLQKECYDWNGTRCVYATKGPQCVNNPATISGNTTTIPLALVPAAFAAKNDLGQLKGILVKNGLLNADEAGALSAAQVTNLLYNYYLQNGRDAYATLLRQFTINSQNVSAADQKILMASVNDIDKAFPAIAAQPTTFDFWSGVWDKIVGSATSVTAPVVTTVKKASPVTLGYIVAGVAVLAIFAWVVVRLVKS